MRLRVPVGLLRPILLGWLFFALCIGFAFCASAAPGDVNGDGTVTPSDIFYLVNALFAGGPAPIGNADANGDGAVTVADIFALVSQIFSAPEPPLGEPYSGPLDFKSCVPTRQVPRPCAPVPLLVMTEAPPPFNQVVKYGGESSGGRLWRWIKASDYVCTLAERARYSRACMVPKGGEIYQTMRFKPAE